MSKRKYIKIQRISPGGLSIQQTEEEIIEKTDDIYFDREVPETVNAVEVSQPIKVPEIPEIIEPIKVPEIPEIIEPIKVPEIGSIDVVPESDTPVKVPEVPEIIEPAQETVFDDVLPVNHDHYDQNKISETPDSSVFVEEVQLLPDPVHIFNQKVRDMMKLRNQKIEKITEAVKEEVKLAPSTLRVKSASNRSSTVSSRRR